MGLACRIRVLIFFLGDFVVADRKLLLYNMWGFCCILVPFALHTHIILLHRCLKNIIIFLYNFNTPFNKIKAKDMMDMLQATTLLAFINFILPVFFL